MKKIFFLFVAIVFTGISASAQCTFRGKIEILVGTSEAYSATPPLGSGASGYVWSYVGTPTVSITPVSGSQNVSVMAWTPGTFTLYVTYYIGSVEYTCSKYITATCGVCQNDMKSNLLKLDFNTESNIISPINDCKEVEVGLNIDAKLEEEI